MMLFTVITMCALALNSYQNPLVGTKSRSAETASCYQAAMSELRQPSPPSRRETISHADSHDPEVTVETQPDSHVVQVRFPW